MGMLDWIEDFAARLDGEPAKAHKARRISVLALKDYSKIKKDDPEILSLTLKSEAAIGYLFAFPAIATDFFYGEGDHDVRLAVTKHTLLSIFDMKGMLAIADRRDELYEANDEAFLLGIALAKHDFHALVSNTTGADIKLPFLVTMSRDVVLDVYQSARK